MSPPTLIELAARPTVVDAETIQTSYAWLVAEIAAWRPGAPHPCASVELAVRALEFLCSRAGCDAADTHDKAERLVRLVRDNPPPVVEGIVDRLLLGM